MQIRRIRLEELAECKRLMSQAFEFSFPDGDAMDDPLAYSKKAAKKAADKTDKNWEDIWAAFTDDGEMMSCMACLPYRMYFDGAAAPMTGIGGVCTRPQYRRGGAIRACFTGALRQMYERGQVFSSLYPFNESFYARFGYERCCDFQLWGLDISRIPAREYPGTFELYDGGGKIKVYDEVYRQVAPRYNGMIKRDKYDWDRLRHQKPYTDRCYGYIYRDASGRPTGYFVFSKDGDRVMNCLEFLFADREALCAMMSFVTRFAADYRLLQFEAPIGLDLSHFCCNYPGGLSARTQFSGSMIRAVSVQKVLELAKYRGSGRVSVSVTDPVLEENTGVWTVTFRAGRCVSAEKGEEKPDVEMGVGAFSAAMMGRLPCESFEWRPDITVHRRTGLEKVFYPKLNWMPNRF